MNAKVKEQAREIARHYNIRYKVATYLVKSGFDSVEAIDAAEDNDLLAVSWVGPAVLSILRGEGNPATTWNYKDDEVGESKDIAPVEPEVVSVEEAESLAKSSFNLEIATEGDVSDLEVILDTMLNIVCSNIKMKDHRFSLQFKIL